MPRLRPARIARPAGRRERPKYQLAVIGWQFAICLSIFNTDISVLLVITHNKGGNRTVSLTLMHSDCSVPMGTDYTPVFFLPIFNPPTGGVE